MFMTNQEFDELRQLIKSLELTDRTNRQEAELIVHRARKEIEEKRREIHRLESAIGIFENYLKNDSVEIHTLDGKRYKAMLIPSKHPLNDVRTKWTDSVILARKALGLDR